MGHTLADQPAIGFAAKGDWVEVRVRCSEGARTMRITVGPHRPLEVVVPAGTSEERILGFLRQKRRWINRKVAWSEAVARRSSVLGLERTGVVWVAGRPLRVRRRVDGRAVARIAAPDEVLVSGPASQHVDAIVRWYRREARSRLTRVVRQEAARLGLTYTSIGIRDPRTRWGSCSHSGHLSFSWRLILAPADVLRYVVVHELCHLAELNHSNAFLRALEAADPGWQDSAGWLQKHGYELHLYNPRLAIEACDD